MNNNIKLISSESVTEGHPDKVCDQISDGILDAMLEKDKNSRAAIETFVSNGLVVVGGEAKTKYYVNVDNTVREILKKIGYDGPESGFDCDSVGIMSAIHEQSPEISQGVDANKGEYLEQGAGDQGLMFGYATNETAEFLPLPIVLAHRLARRLAEVRKKKIIEYLKPDGKSQVTMEYRNGLAKRLETVVIAACHQSNINIAQVKKDILNHVVKPVAGDLLDKKTKIYINSTGSFVLGGPAADTGLTGRKIIVDTYGGFARHGGGCFSGKDPSKVDRSGAYMARYVAKNIVAAGLANICELQVAYAIGVAEPVGLYLETFSTNQISEKEILKLVRTNFDFRPKSIIKNLNLKNPIYLPTAAYGHFGRSEFSWEKIDKAKKLKNYL